MYFVYWEHTPPFLPRKFRVDRRASTVNILVLKQAARVSDVLFWRESFTSFRFAGILHDNTNTILYLSTLYEWTELQQSFQIRYKRKEKIQSKTMIYLLGYKVILFLRHFPYFCAIVRRFRRGPPIIWFSNLVHLGSKVNETCVFWLGENTGPIFSCFKFIHSSLWSGEWHIVTKPQNISEIHEKTLLEDCLG